MFRFLLQKAGFKPCLALQSSIPKLLMAAAMVGGAGSLLAAGSAKAVDTCYFGGFVGPIGFKKCVSTAPGAADETQVLSIGDKTVTFSALPAGAGQQGSITFLNSVQDFFALKTNFLDSALLAPATGTLAYKVNIVSGLQTFKGVQLSVDAFGSTTLVKSETSPGGPRFNTLTSLNSTSPIPSASLFEPVNFTGLTELAVLDVFTLVNPSSLSSFTNTFQQSPINVPGPLPVMGAGIAFGFSRKLRGWIKASATV